MHSVKIFFVILSIFLYFCNGCIRNTAAQVGPTITTGSMFPTVTTATAMSTTTTTTCAPSTCLFLDAEMVVIIGTEMVDANCVYTRVITCNDPTIEDLSIRFSIFQPREIIAAPLTLTCMAGSYFYNGAMGLSRAGNIDCV